MKTAVNYKGNTIKVKTNSVLVDPEKLDQCLKKRGLDWHRAAEEMGFSRRTLSDTLRQGVIGVTVAHMLKMCYNIRPEEYQFIPEEPKAEPVPAQGPEAVQKQINMDDVIRMDNSEALIAVIKQAIQEVFAEQKKALQGAIIGAVAANRDVYYKSMLDAIMDARTAK